MRNRPLPVIARSLGLLIAGKVRFDRGQVGRNVTREDGQVYEIFREITVEAGDAPPPESVFRVWFHANTSYRVTRAYSMLTTVFFIGMNGFRHKIYLVDHATGELGGIYHWQTVADAEAYAASFAMTLSEKRSLSGHFRKEVFAFTDPRAAVGADSVHPS